MKKGKSHYEVLGVTRKSTQEEVVAAYRKLAWAKHPDKLGGGEKANSDFAEITSAYAVLSDVKDRRRYDAKLMLASTPCPACEGKGAISKQRGFASKTWSPCAACAGSGLKKSGVLNQ